MRGRITKCLAGIHRPGQFGSVGADDHRADRHVTGARRRGDRQCGPDQVFVAWSPTEAVDHRRQLVGEAHLPGDAAQLFVGV